MSKKEKNNIWTEFNEERTNFWVSIGFSLIESIIPGILLWVFFGYDFKTSIVTELPFPNVGWVSLIMVGYFLWTVLSTIIFYYIKGHKADNFTYSITFTFVIISIILNGAWLPERFIFHFVRFLFAFGVAAGTGVIGVLFTNFFRNIEFKKDEEMKIVVEAYRRGKEIPSNKQAKVIRLEKQREKEEIKKRKMIEFQARLDYKIKKELEERAKKESEIDSKLDQKEQKLRQKDKSKSKEKQN